MKKVLGTLATIAVMLSTSNTAYSSSAEVIFKVIKETVDILPNEVVVKSASKTISKNSNPLDLLKASSIQKVIIRDKGQQADLIVDIANGGKKSLKSISEDSSSLLSSLNFKSSEELHYWANPAYLGKNSKNEHVFIKATALQKTIIDEDIAITSPSTIEVRLARTLTANESKNLDKDFAKFHLALLDSFSQKIKAAYTSQGRKAIRGADFDGGNNATVVTTKDNKKVMMAIFSLDAATMDSELVKQILMQITK